jgi:TonB-dependent SusC/RagA subfamily outer membrane receptor
MQPFKPLLSLATLLFVFVIASHAQAPVKDYEKEWQKVDELISKKNLPESALAEVKKIYALAKKEKQDAQLIKAVVYLTGLQQENREDNEVVGIKEIEKEISANKEPVVSIFKSLLAEVYWNYFQNNRWKIYNRTETNQFKKDDISAWGAGDFHKKISELYLQSIKDEKLLQQTRLNSFEAIIIKGNVRHLRPTLYDLLAHRALDYFKNDEREIAKPAYAFEIDQPFAFDAASDFVTRKFITKDSSSLQHKALLIYQKLLAFHLYDTKPDALLDTDIQRLEFVHENSTHPDKKELFRLALNRMANKYGNHPAVAQAWYLLAKEYNEDADKYKPFGDTTHRYERLKAKEICETILKQKDSSEGKINCYNLLNEISKKDLQFSLEKVNVPGQPFRALINYRNIGQLYLRIIIPNEKLKEKLGNYYDEKLWAELMATSPLRSWQQNLPATHDYQQHSVEIKLDALPPGEYILLAASDDFSKNAVMGARLFYVSNISFINQGKNYFVLHRETGKPLASASVQLWEQVYDYKNYKYSIEKGNRYQSDSNGFFSITEKKKKENNRRRENYKLEINWNGERLFMDDWMYDYYYSNINEPDDEDENIRIFYFIDRSIYRPGQTVFFKGIAIKYNKEKTNNVAPGFSTKIFLENANNEDADSLTVTTNEYGSFSGKFQLPTGVLNSEFSIYDEEDYGKAEFSVEEYKRPKFYVEYEKLKGTYKVNDTIKVTGLAKAYAGNNIDGAAVKYRVVREPRFIYPWLFSRWWQPPTEKMEIAHGETKTGKDGKFVLEFEAIPDKTLDKKFDPVFDYKIYADVTDINGETRSGETEVSVSYKSLLLKVDMPNSLPADSLKNISVRSENMAGEFVPAKVKVSMSKLKEEKRLIRSRYWERPDQFVMNKEEYVKNFPHDEYADESDFKSWGKGERVFEKEDSTKENSPWSIFHVPWSPGFYIIEVSTKDTDGNEVKDIKYIELTDEKSHQLGQPKYLWTQSSNQPIESGEKTTVEMGTSADNLFIIQELDKTHDSRLTTHDYQFTILNNEKKSFDFTATEADRGGYGVSWIFVKHNRFYFANKTIVVPWSNKDLKIEYATFRDKTLPGSEEKWKVKITGYKKEIVAAEMLASMYDASLDQFKMHSWSKPQIWPYYSAQRTWNSSTNFSYTYSQKKWMAETDRKFLSKSYDALLEINRNRFQLAEALAGRVAGVSVEKNKLFEKPEAPDSITLRGATSISANNKPLIIVDGIPVESYEYLSPSDIINMDVLKSEAAIAIYGSRAANGVVIITTKKGEKSKLNEIKARKNFSETAFFIPDLRTDSSGAIEFSFTIPEALTKWKFQALAHTKDLALGYSSKEIVTQKQLMVQPNVPRFLREGDKMEFSTKIVNLTDKELTGQAELQLFDATTNESVSGWFRNMFPNQYFTVAAGQSEAVMFPIEVPYLFDKALTWRLVAKASPPNGGGGLEGAVSDGEEAAMAVLTNRMLVTETMPLNMRGTGTKNFTFEKLLKSGAVETQDFASLQHHSLTVEYTSNPAWYAVQALPYLMEYPYECAEQTWNRYYANALASKIANSSPRIKEVFSKWLESSKVSPVGGDLEGALQKNQELKAVLLEETPWVLQAKTEEQQKKNIALLFDLIRMSNEMNSAYEKLKQLQSPNGGFVWFKGGPDNAYMTQYIVTGIGHLKKLSVETQNFASLRNSILKTAIPYLDRQIKKTHDDLKRNKTDFSKYIPGHYEIQYLYMRSFFPEQKIPEASQTAYTYFRSRARQTWMKQSKYIQGMIALALNRTGDAKTPAVILKSLKETSITHEELGMYWKENSGGWFWHQAPIETQALLIEAFQEIDVKTQDFASQQKTVDDLKIWLLKNKQTNSWKTTKATAEACYALLLQGAEWLTSEPVVEIKLGNTTIKSTDNKQEAGTGYFKKVIAGPLVNSEMGNISIRQESSKIPPSGIAFGKPSATEGGGGAWGGVYWQYFENLDKITTATTPLKLDKKLFVETNTDRGPVLIPLFSGEGTGGEVLKVGDKIKVRIELRVDRDMEYVHMKDMRASCLEPVNVLSGYKWQGGLGYYETTKDASANFFFDYLRKGTYVFEYSLFVTNTGNFSNGITSIQCMYAPEFASHSEGIRILVK